MNCFKNTHLKFLFISLITFTFIIIIVLYYFGIYEPYIIKTKLVQVTKDEFELKQLNDTIKKKQTMINEQQLKFIVYECRGWCGGFADRLKGKTKVT